MTSVRALILAAGRGERMRPLTDTCPKPLLAVRGKALIDWHIEALARDGLTDIVINTAWLGEMISAHCTRPAATQPGFNLDESSGQPNKDGHKPLSISYSHEGRDFGCALETAGGIARALPSLGEIFWVLAGDVFVPDFEFSHEAVERFSAGQTLAHLWLVTNPAHNPQGDFGLDGTGLALNLPSSPAQPRWTFSTIALYRKAFFAGLPFGNPQGLKAPLAPLLRAAMDNQQVSAELYRGCWTDVGTPARLAELNQTTTEG